MTRPEQLEIYFGGSRQEAAANAFFARHAKSSTSRQATRTRSPTAAEACQDRGVLAMERKDWDEAIEQFDKLVKLQPKNAEAYYFRAGAWHSKEQFDKAIADYDAALRLRPRYADALYGRGAARDQQGLPALAITDLDAALGLVPDDVEARCLRGKIREEAGEYNFALRDYQEAVKVDSDNPAVLNCLAWLLATAPEAGLRDGRRAVEAAARAVQLERGTEWDTIDTLGAAFAEAGRFAEAVRCAKEALKLAPPSEHPDLEARLKLFLAKQPFRLPEKSH